MSVDLAVVNESLSAYGAQAQYQDWDTSILGKKVFSITLPCECTDKKINAKALLEALKKHAPALVCIKLPALKPILRESIEDAGCHLVECFLTFEHNLKITPDIPMGDKVRAFRESDLEPLLSLSGESFLYSRYHSDPRIEKEKADISRQEWLKNACNGRAEKVYVAEYNGEVAGFVLCKHKGAESVNLDLIAVARQHQGRGLGECLVKQFLNYAREQEFKYATVGTQSHNVPSVRMYEKSGFRLTQSMYSYHAHLAL